MCTIDDGYEVVDDGMMEKMTGVLVVVFCLFLSLSGCGRDDSKSAKRVSSNFPDSRSATVVLRTEPEPLRSSIVVAAQSQIGKTTIYDPAYVRLTYPMGDVPMERGVCTDVVIRALRTALNVDLQKLVHEDMKLSFSDYPSIWGLRSPDRNIDHRRVLNLRKYFERQGYSIEVTQEKGDYLPGDIVTCTVGRNLAHIMIVSDRKDQNGVPLVIHNMGSGTKEEHSLFSFPITGHYRIMKVVAVK